MSLLLDARKKSQQTQPMRDDIRASQALERPPQEHPAEKTPLPDATAHIPQPEHSARSAGQNLFSTKSLPAPPARTLPNRNLLLTLGGTILLLGIGGAYLWWLDSAYDTRPLRPVSTPIAQIPATAATNTQPTSLVPGISESITAVTESSAPAENSAGGDAREMPREAASQPAENTSAATAQPPPQGNNPIRVEQQKALLDPLIRDAYFAYRSGDLDEAQQLYLTLFKKDVRNTDALLGLATIAQRHGEDQMAAQYYAQVLALDPRNAMANAGMSSLSADNENNESHLKLLLREQGNSAILHFALANLYAGQSRWGEAQQSYFNAWTLDSGNAEYAFNLAVSLDHLGQRQLAAQYYQRALQLDPSHTTGLDHAQASLRAQALAR